MAFNQARWGSELLRALVSFASIDFEISHKFDITVGDDSAQQLKLMPTHKNQLR